MEIIYLQQAIHTPSLVFAMLQTTDLYVSLLLVVTFSWLKGSSLVTTKYFIHTFVIDGQLWKAYFDVVRGIKHTFSLSYEFTSLWDSGNKNVLYYVVISYSRINLGFSIVVTDCSSMVYAPDPTGLWKNKNIKETTWFYLQVTNTLSVCHEKNCDRLVKIASKALIHREKWLYVYQTKNSFLFFNELSFSVS